ncbi:unnamed protein product [Thlaspi arvense]|uniref:Uncharacterized protein n=1 Tax=Thlaspi arvense TaxID=13288 RepID=A0AAU9RHI5_THLAR|nr:unnamed protein product [Thlaspi arvense]
MMEEGKLRSILDSKLQIDDEDERVITAVKVALWCIQDDMHLRPPMTKVVQMLEGLCGVPLPPTASQTGSRLYSSLFKSSARRARVLDHQTVTVMPIFLPCDFQGRDYSKFCDSKA